MKIFPTLLGTLLLLFGALLLAPESVTDALTTLGRTAVGWLPWMKKDKTAEHDGGDA